MKKFIIFFQKFVSKWIKPSESRTSVKNRALKPQTGTKHKTEIRTNEVPVKTERYLMQGYEFRFNSLTETTEFRQRGSGKPFALIDQRQLNTFCLDARMEGIDCWDRDISRLIHSTRIDSYHPFVHYMSQLPAWDGTDRVTPFSKRVSANGLWVESFHRWLLALTAQWMGMNGGYGNSMPN